MNTVYISVEMVNAKKNAMTIDVLTPWTFEHEVQHSFKQVRQFQRDNRMFLIGTYSWMLDEHWKLALRMVQTMPKYTRRYE